MGGFSFMQLRKNPVRTITYLAFLVALDIVLNRFCSINTAGYKIGFAFVPIVIAAAVFGPVAAAVSYALADFLGAILFPIGPYHPGFTICAALMGIMYGIFLYKPDDPSVKTLVKWDKIRFFPNVVIPAFVNNLVFGLLINTIWVAMLYGSKTYGGWFLYRLPEYAILIPMNLILTPILLKLCNELKKIAFKKVR